MIVFVDKKVVDSWFFSRFGESVLFKEGELESYLSKYDVSEEVAFVVRTTTRVDESLLKGRRVRWVATATAGDDHLDRKFLEISGIPVFVASGCNSQAVCEYVVCALQSYFQKNGENWRKSEAWKDKRIFLAGLGNVGRRIFHALSVMGAEVLPNDPPLRDSGDRRYPFIDLKEAKSCDVVIFCVPLNKEGPYRTQFYLEESFFKSLEKSPLFVNVCRGSIVKSEILLRALEEGNLRDCILDVYQSEPDLSLADRSLVERSFIATPHMAGYSAEGKRLATKILYQKIARYEGIEESVIFPPDEALDPFPPSDQLYPHLFDIGRASSRFKEGLRVGNSVKDFFLGERQLYVNRREFAHRLKQSGTFFREKNGALSLELEKIERIIQYNNSLQRSTT